MPVPKFDALMLPLLKIASDGQEHRLNDVIQPIANALGLSDADREEQIPSGQSRLRNRIYWAKLYLRGYSSKNSRYFCVGSPETFQRGLGYRMNIAVCPILSH